MSINNYGRKKNSIINGVYALIGYFFVIILSLVVRKFFITEIGEQYLGYEGLFRQLFAVMSFTEGGVVSVATVLLYKYLAAGDEESTSMVMYTFKIANICVSAIVLVLGVFLLPFLPQLVTGSTIDPKLMYVVYAVQLLATVITYSISHFRNLYFANQTGYICTKIDLACEIFFSILCVVMMLVTRSFILYFFVVAFKSVAQYWIIYIKGKKDFPYLKHEKISRKFIEDNEMDVDIKYGMLASIAGVIRNSLDVILITKIVGVLAAGMFSNYKLVYNGVSALINSSISGLSSAFGNYHHTKGVSTDSDLFKAMQFAFYIIGSFVAINYVVLSQPFISLWLGESMLLPLSVAICCALEAYFRISTYQMSLIRGAVGKKKVDSGWYMVIAIMDLIISIVLGIQMGITGILIGTVFDRMVGCFVISIVAYKYAIKKSFVGHFLKDILKFGIIIIITVILFRYTPTFNTTVIGFVERIAFTEMILIVLTLFAVVFSTDGRAFCRYLYSMKKK